MHWIYSAYLVLLFVLLSPGTFVTLPPHGSKIIVLFVHTALFALVWHFTMPFVKNLEYMLNPPLVAPQSKLDRVKDIYADAKSLIGL